MTAGGAPRTTGRILMLTDFYIPFIGGVVGHVHTLSRELRLRGYEVAVATLGRPGLSPFEVEDGIRIYRLQGSLQRLPRLFRDPKRRWAPPCPDPELTYALRRIVARERPSLVHSHSWIVHSFMPLKRWSGVPLVVTLHEMGLRCAKKNLIHAGHPCSGPGPVKCLGCCAREYGVFTGPVAAAALHAAGRFEMATTDMFLPVSQAIAEGSGLIGSGLPFEVIPNFIPDDLPGPTPLRSVSSRLPSSPYLLYVGALSRHKGLQVLLEAYALLTLDIPLVLIGTCRGDLPAPLPPGVLVHRNWPRVDVLQAMGGSVLTIVPSLVPEASPTVVLEAMASERPVVASRVGGIPEMICHGEHGFLVPPGNPQALADAIAALLKDPERRQRMGQAGRARVKVFQAGTVMPRIETVYARVEGRRVHVA